MNEQSSLIWSKKGDFHFEQDSPVSLIRCVEYTSLQAERAIQKLELFGYRTGKYTVRIIAKNSETHQAIGLILSIHSVPHVNYSSYDSLIDCYSSNINDLKQFINALTPHYAELEAIKPEIFEYLDSAAALPVSNSESSAITENPTPATIPSASSDRALNAPTGNPDPQQLASWLAATTTSLAAINVEIEVALAQASSVLMSSLVSLFSTLPFSPLMASMAMRDSVVSLRHYRRLNQSSEDNLQAALDQSFAEAEANASTSTSDNPPATRVHRREALLDQSVGEANASTTISDIPPATLVHSPEVLLDQIRVEANASTTTSDNPPATLERNAHRIPNEEKKAEEHLKKVSHLRNI